VSVRAFVGSAIDSAFGSERSLLERLDVTRLQVNRQRVFIPEVVQTTAMDCGPACLKAILEGFDIPVSYGHLREACQTSLDGTSIDTLEDVANLAGLDAEQVMMPLDHVLTPEAEALPAVIVTRLPDGATHFVVVWRLHGSFVQIMDPARGRRWVTKRRFQEEIYQHQMPFPASVWREWAGSDAFCHPLQRRLIHLGMTEAEAANLIATAKADESWVALAGLDASVRFGDALGRAGSITPTQIKQIVQTLFARILEADITEHTPVPWAYWLVCPLLQDEVPEEASAQPGAETELLFNGAVLLHIQHRAASAPEESVPEESGPGEAVPGENLHEDGAGESGPQAAEKRGQDASGVHGATAPSPIRHALTAALSHRDPSPEGHIFSMLRADGLLRPSLLTAGILLAALGVVAQALFLRGIVDLWRNDALSSHRLLLVGTILSLAALLLLLEVFGTASILHLGRRMEMRLRLAFLEKLPKLSDAYFRSRLTSDMARRAYDIQNLRGIPLLGFSLLQTFFLLIGTGLGLIWLDPASAPLVAGMLLVNLLLISLAQPVQAEMDQRIQTHASSLNRFFLDALLGLLPVRSHSAGHAVGREYEMRLTAWLDASRANARLRISLESLLGLISMGFAVAVVFFYIARGREAAGVLLLLYWSLTIPILARRLADLARQYPRQRNRLQRLLEPLTAEEGVEASAGADGTSAAPLGLSLGMAEAARPARLTFSRVDVMAGGHPILEGIDLVIEPGEHVAIVGRSGAGKSSLVGLLLGWHRPATGTLRVDGQPLSGEKLASLRTETVWIDPSVQIWNRSLLENLLYGLNDAGIPPTGPILQQAELTEVLRKLPAGVQARLGEGGGLLSGGEGQRVRLGRGLMRPHPRLVILDEAFRGLDRTQRHRLMSQTRGQWQDATLLCITHHVSETLLFDRVLVMAGGRIVEDAAPGILAGQPDSLYRQMLAQEEAVQREIWGSGIWQRFQMRGGLLSQTGEMP
jgi:ATP-binding cassette subfamily B protein